MDPEASAKQLDDLLTSIRSSVTVPKWQLVSKTSKRLIIRVGGFVDSVVIIETIPPDSATTSLPAWADENTFLVGYPKLGRTKSGQQFLNVVSCFAKGDFVVRLIDHLASNGGMWIDGDYEF